MLFFVFGMGGKEKEEENLPKGATSVMEPVNETKGLVPEIADPIGASKRRRVEQNTGSSAILGLRLGNPVPVIWRQIFTDAELSY